jgi:uncharacterized protein YjiS (DUF1127 family)
MKKIYLMSAVAMNVVVAVVSQMRAAEALSPACSGLRQRLYAAAAGLSRRVWRIVNNWIAAMIAYREQQVTLSALGTLSDTELKDFGVYRGSPGSAFHRHRDVKFKSTR